MVGFMIVNWWLMVAEFVMMGHLELGGFNFAKILTECGVET